MRWCVQDSFERAKFLDELCVDPELVNQIEAMHQGEHPRGKAEQHYERIECPMQRAAEPALADGDAEVVLLARVVDDVEIPEQPALMADAMKDVIHKVVYKEQRHPSPPRIGGKLVWGDLIAILIYIYISETEHQSPADAQQAQEDV